MIFECVGCCEQPPFALPSWLLKRRCVRLSLSNPRAHAPDAVQTGWRCSNGIHLESHLRDYTDENVHCRIVKIASVLVADTPPPLARIRQWSMLSTAITASDTCDLLRASIMDDQQHPQLEGHEADHRGQTGNAYRSACAILAKGIASSRSSARNIPKYA